MYDICVHIRITYVYIYHELVLGNLKLKLLSQKTNHSNRCRFNLEKLKDESVRNKYEQELQIQLSQLKIDRNTTNDNYTYNYNRCSQYLKEISS